MRESTKRKYPRNWRAISKRIIAERGGVCERDGLPSRPRKPLGSHHKNGDPSNCRDENIKVLCPRCHFRVQLGYPLDITLEGTQLNLL